MKKLSEKIPQTLEQFKKLIRCGFELETQSTNGATASGDDYGDEIDHEAADEAINEQVSDELENYYSIFDSYLDSEHFLYNLSRDQLRSVANALDISCFEDWEEFGVDTDDIRQSVRERVADYFDYGEYYIPNDNHGVDICGITVTTDGSVDGFELKTNGAKTIEEFLDLSKEVFKEDHYIDERCSFHIHLSVDGIRHQYGQNFQGLVIKNTLELLPANHWYKERLDGRQYFRHTCGLEKFSIVRFHKHFGTYEFRIFGNIKNHTDAASALNQAIIALYLAYKQKLNGEKIEENYHDICGRAMSDCLGYNEAKEELRIEALELNQSCLAAYKAKYLALENSYNRYIIALKLSSKFRTDNAKLDKLKEQLCIALVRFEGQFGQCKAKRVYNMPLAIEADKVFRQGLKAIAA